MATVPDDSYVTTLSVRVQTAAKSKNLQLWLGAEKFQLLKNRSCQPQLSQPQSSRPFQAVMSWTEAQPGMCACFIDSAPEASLPLLFT